MSTGAEHLLPVGKLPPDLLAKILSQAPVDDPRLLLGPGIGLDCAVIDHGASLLVYKSDPITFTTEEIGWYAVQVNANDIVTAGAEPRWLLVTLLLPEGSTTPELPEEISRQIYSACREIGVTVIGGHTEITYGLNRPILIGTMIGEVDRQRLITPQGARPGDKILLTKGVPIEATTILAREFVEELYPFLSPGELRQAQDYLHHPGISILPEAKIATQTGTVHAMHDPTEGGFYTAVWELAEACGCSLFIEPGNVPVSQLSAKICQGLGVDPLGAIASGALLIVSPPEDADRIEVAIQSQGIDCVEVGTILQEEDKTQVFQTGACGWTLLPRPERDAIARLFE